MVRSLSVTYINEVDISFFITCSSHERRALPSSRCLPAIQTGHWSHRYAWSGACTVRWAFLGSSFFSWKLYVTFKNNNCSWFIMSNLTWRGLFGLTTMSLCSRQKLHVTMTFSVSPSANRMLPWLCAGNTLALCLLQPCSPHIDLDGHPASSFFFAMMLIPLFLSSSQRWPISSLCRAAICWFFALI